MQDAYKTVVCAILVSDDNYVLLSSTESSGEEKVSKGEEDGRTERHEREVLWEFPGGKLEEGEDLETCILRELSEELGISTDARCLSPFTFACSDKHLILYYICWVWEDEGKEIESKEGREVRWVKVEDISKCTTWKTNRQVCIMLRDFLN